MSASNVLETAALKKFFTNVDDAAMTALLAAGSVYISLHTGDPGEAGGQDTSETAYTGYARVAVTRDTNGFTVSGDTCTNAADLTYGQCSASPGGNLTHAAVGLSSSGAGTLLLSGALPSPVVMQVGTVPIFSAGELDLTCA